MNDDTDLRTVVTESYAVEIPQSLREEIQLEPGDVVQWNITDSGRLLADVVEEDTES